MGTAGVGAIVLLTAQKRTSLTCYGNDMIDSSIHVAVAPAPLETFVGSFVGD